MSTSLRFEDFDFSGSMRDLSKGLLVPLLDREGSVQAHAQVSPEDYERVIAEGRWSCGARGYVFRNQHLGMREGRQVRRALWLHHFVLGIEPGSGVRVDHEDRDRLNNTRSNLRIATHAENMQNLPVRRGGTSQYRGVSWDPTSGRWRARGQLLGKRYFLGLYDTEEAADRAAVEWRREHLPFAEERQ